MKELKAYLVRVEVKGDKGSAMPTDAKGAFVNCVVPGKDRDDAIHKLEKALAEDKYLLVKIDKIDDFDKLEFDPRDEHYLQMAKDAVRSGSVYYGEFNIW